MDWNKTNYKRYYGNVDSSSVVIEVTLTIVRESPSLVCYEWNENNWAKVYFSLIATIYDTLLFLICSVHSAIKQG
jgi:hypothetical protein